MGSSPADLLVGIIFFINKKPNKIPSEPKDLRPIVCLKILYKIFEKIIKNRLDKLINFQVSPLQMGGVKNVSTQNAL